MRSLKRKSEKRNVTIIELKYNLSFLWKLKREILKWTNFRLEKGGVYESEGYRKGGTERREVERSEG